jgi:hypothetical protein
VYVGTVVGNVYAYSSTGTLLWHASNGKDLQRWDPVSVAGKVVFAASDGTVLAYPLSCRSDGGLCAASWTQAAGANGNLNAANGIIYVPSSSGGIHRLLPATGASAGPDVNPFAATAPVTTSMSVGADGTEFWGSGSTYTWTSTTGFSSTSGPAGGTVSDAAIANNDIYFTSSDGQLHKFGPSGWAAAVTGSGCSIAPAVMQGVAYAAGCTSIGAYDERTGALIWSVPEGNVSGISTANGVVYACAAPPGASGSELVAYDAGYGGKLWSGGSCNDTPEVVNGKLYAGVGAVEVYDTAPTPARQHGGRQR